jgi:hypothetical protein
VTGPPDAVLRRLAAGEPRTTLALGALLGNDRQRDAKIVTVGPGERSVCAIVRAEAGVWSAFPVLGDAADATLVAEVIARSSALAVAGARADVEPLLPLLRRAVSVQSLRRIVVPWGPIDWPAPGPATRVATALDLEALYELYEGFELTFGRTRRGQRAAIREAVHVAAVVVLDGDRGGLDGAVIATTRTPKFVEWSQLTVRPSARGRGASWELMARAIGVTLASGLGVVAVMGPGNPMTLPELGTVDEVTVVQLDLPARVPGERFVRRMWFGLDRARHRRPLKVVDAGRRPARGPDGDRGQPE